MSFKLSIIDPNGKLYEDTVDSVAVTGTQGAFEVYSGHMPIIASLKAGLARVRRQGHEIPFEITGGILEVDLKHNVTLLADQATAVK